LTAAELVGQALHVVVAAAVADGRCRRHPVVGVGYGCLVCEG
jgi:hypothetical protein